jgi:hypothetical protein
MKVDQPGTRSKKEAIAEKNGSGGKKRKRNK